MCSSTNKQTIRTGLFSQRTTISRIQTPSLRRHWERLKRRSRRRRKPSRKRSRSPMLVITPDKDKDKKEAQLIVASMVVTLADSHYVIVNLLLIIQSLISLTIRTTSRCWSQWWWSWLQPLGRFSSNSTWSTNLPIRTSRRSDRCPCRWSLVRNFLFELDWHGCDMAWISLWNSSGQWWDYVQWNRVRITKKAWNWWEKKCQKVTKESFIDQWSNRISLSKLHSM